MYELVVSARTVVLSRMYWSVTTSITGVWVTRLLMTTQCFVASVTFVVTLT